MKSIVAISSPWVWTLAVQRETLSWVGGLGFTFGLFFAMAHFENVERRAPLDEIEDVPAGSILLEPPPPAPQVAEQTPPTDPVPLTGIEVAASDSPVKIAAVPPDLAALMPEPRIPQKALVELGRFHPELKPTIDTGLDARHVYQQAEVDQRPRAIIRTAPFVGPELFGKAKSLRVILLLLIDTKGRIESARVMTTSGNAAFDDLVAQTVKDEWVFSAAVKRGRNVRCLAQQGFRVNLPGATPFSLE